MRKEITTAYVVAGAAGGAVAVGLMQLLSEHASFPLMMVPFATSIVLVLGTPDAEPAQPRALVGGHLLSTAVGLLVLSVTGHRRGRRRSRSDLRWRSCMSPAPFIRRPESIP